MQGKIGDANIDDGHVDQSGGQEGETNLEIRTDIYVLLCVWDRQWDSAVKHRELSSVLCDDPERTGWGGWEGSSRGKGYMYPYS